MILDYKETQIYYHTKGTGNPLVLLHGFLESSNIWKRLIPALVKKRQVVIIDLPGHGKSGTLGNVHSMEEMAQVVKTVLDTLKLPWVSLAGHSMGGYVALAFLEQYPRMVSSLLLINSTPEADSPERMENRHRAIKLLQKNKNAFIRMSISNLVPPDRTAMLKKELHLLKEDAQNFSTSGVIAAIEGMKIRTEKIEVLKRFNGKKILVCGMEDPLWNWKRAEEIATITDSGFVLMKTGHLSYLEEPTKIEELLHFMD